MNYRLIAYTLGIVAFIMGTSMLLALPWTFPLFGGNWGYEQSGFYALFVSILISFGLGLFLCSVGDGKTPRILIKEAMAIVPLSWIFAILLGAVPYILSGMEKAPGKPITAVDAIFESTSGLTTTGATILTELENPETIPRSLLFWRAETNFLGGLGIMVFFVVLLGHGMAGKSMMKIEKGAAGGTSRGKVRSYAFSLAGVYLSLIAVLTLLLCLYGLSFFDAICHAFSTVATGGFSNYNASIGHFAAETGLNAPLIESTLVFFMIIGGSNFVLLYFFFTGQPRKLLGDTEWLTYLGIIAVASLIVCITGIYYGDFDDFGTSASPIHWVQTGITWIHSFRQSLFQVVSLMTSTGFCTDEYEKWNSISLVVFLAVIFLGGCVGGTSGGIKIFRGIVTIKTLHHELEKSYRPNVVRPVKIGGVVIDKETQFSVITFILLFLVSISVVTFIVLLIEPSSIWTMGSGDPRERFADVLSASFAMFSNTGPGFGIVGAEHNYDIFTPVTKLIFSWAMLLGRLELYLPLVIFTRSFWSSTRR